MLNLSERKEPLKAGLKVYFYSQFPGANVTKDSISFVPCIRGTGKLWGEGDSITGFLKIEEIEELVKGCWNGEVYINWDENKDSAVITTEHYPTAVGAIQSLLIEKQENYTNA